MTDLTIVLLGIIKVILIFAPVAFAAALYIFLTDSKEAHHDN